MKFFFMMVCSFLFCANVAAQDETKWQKEVDQLTSIDYEVMIAFDLAVLTGSSSARLWKTVQNQFQEINIINNGFGGSQMHELLYYIDELVIKYRPDKIFIYEGDNDISAGKSTDQIMKSTKEVVAKIKAALPDAQIYFISPKPSLARWELAPKYIDLNKTLKDYCDETDKVTYIDVWYPMLDEKGEPIKEIFIEDGLHMNEKGYEIWRIAVAPYMDE